MITSNTSHGKRSKLYGLSTDTKPSDVTNGSTFFEMDTSKKYWYDADTNTWYKDTSGGGGGGGDLRAYRTAAEQDLIDALKMSEPETEGTNGQVLTTDGAGGRTWTTPSGGGGGGVFVIDLYYDENWNVTTDLTPTEISNALFDKKMIFAVLEDDGCYDTYKLEYSSYDIESFGMRFTGQYSQINIFGMIEESPDPEIPNMIISVYDINEAIDLHYDVEQLDDNTMEISLMDGDLEGTFKIVLQPFTFGSSVDIFFEDVYESYELVKIATLSTSITEQKTARIFRSHNGIIMGYDDDYNNIIDEEGALYFAYRSLGRDIRGFRKIVIVSDGSMSAMNLSCYGTPYM